MRSLIPNFGIVRGKRGKPRPRVKPLWRTRSALLAVALLAVSSGLGAAAWSWQSGWLHVATQSAKWSIIAASADFGFIVEDVLVIGRQETSRSRLLSAVGIERGAPILAFDPGTAKRRIEALPWVKSATVSRRLPDTIVVRLVERKALAIWQNKGTFSLIDQDGEVIADDQLDRFLHLVLVVGDDAPAHAVPLLELLWKEPELGTRVKSAIRVGQRRWNVRLDNGIDVRLPEVDPAGAWSRLADYERRHQLLGRDISTLDLRLPDRLIVQKSPGPGRRGPGQET